MKRILLVLAIALSTASYSQLTDANFQAAINDCLTLNPIDGLCIYGEYGVMPDWDVSQVTNMAGAFLNLTDFNADISSWDVSNVTNMSFMFQYAGAFNQDISSWDVSNVTTMSWIFANAPVFNQDISSWDVSKVLDMSYMFFGTKSFNQPLNSWDVSNVIDMSYMFQGASNSSTISAISAFNQPLNNWDVSNVTIMRSMFYNAYVFNQDISSWNVSNVTDMSYMFYNANTYNQDISSWDVSNVTEMEYMFYKTLGFNQDISSWCVTNIVSEPSDFSTESSLIESNKPIWGFCSTASVDNQTQLDISIYPNPTSDIVYIEGNYSQLKVVVYDILGKQVIKESITNSVDISQLEKGVYIIQLSDGAKLTTERILKK